MLIGIDFDGVLNNMLELWLSCLNQRHSGYQVKIEDITDWELSKAYPILTEAELFAPIDEPEFWEAVSIKPEAPEVVERLLAEGHKIYIITSSYYKTLFYKFERCLFKHFPYLKKEDIIITYDKSLIRVDLLLDDAEHNLKDFQGIRVLFDAPYNKDCTCADYRVASWKEFYLLVSELSSSHCRPSYTRIKQFKAERGAGKTAWLQQMIYDSTHLETAVSAVPCYLIALDNKEYISFCRSYLRRFGEACPAKQYELNQELEESARLFVDTPSLLPVQSQAFASFRNKFIDRQHLLFVADFKNTYWNFVY